jgi:uncharacterized membrane protein
MDSTINPDDFGTIKQLEYIAMHPRAFCFVLVNTLRTFGANFYKAFIGVLGWYDVFVPRWYIVAASISIALAFVASTPKREGSWLPSAAAAGTALVGCLVALMTTQYLAWTPVGLDIVLGIQGRYFIAPALFGVMLCPSLALPHKVRSAFAATTIGFTAIVSVPLTCFLIVDRYYLA